jgi:hypothetical protein
MPFVDVNLLPGDDYARIGICGPEGSGKTLIGLKLARGIVGPQGRIALIDTENRSSRKFRAFERFDVQPIEGNYAPAIYVAAIHEAERLKYDALVVDSLSPAWNAPGGALDTIDSLTKGNKKLNRSAWAKVTPEHNRLVQAIVHAKLNIICTLRVKTDYAEIETPDGRRQWKKIGLAPIQRDGFLYEFDMVIDLDVDHELVFSKSRLPVLDKTKLFTPTRETRRMEPLVLLHRNLAVAEQLGGQIAEWLRTGEGKTRAQMVEESIRGRAIDLGRYDETLEAMLEAAGGDLQVLDQILADIGDGAAADTAADAADAAAGDDDDEDGDDGEDE